MSSFTDFAGGIKGIQRGTISCVFGSLTATATITSVTTTKSELRLLGQRLATNDTSQLGTIELTNATTITFTRGASGTAVNVSWELTEFY